MQLHSVNVQKETVRIPSAWFVKEIAAPLLYDVKPVKVQEVNVADCEGVCRPSCISESSHLLTVP